MSIEGGKFLDSKYKDLAGSQEVSRAVEKAKSDPDRVFAPHTRNERIEAYLDRLDYIITDERGWRRLKQKMVNEFGVDTHNPEVLTKLAHNLYEAEKRLAIERGQGGDIDRLAPNDVIAHYEKAIHEKRDIQEQGVTKWLEYLKQNDAQYPTWFRYFVVRNLAKMGNLNKEKIEYSKRNQETLAPFPELNPEALGFVYRMLTTGLGSEEFVDEPEMRTAFLELIAKKDFPKLYAFAQIETAGALNRESIEGEWVKYDQGSDHHVLEQALRGKGTGWCTAEGSAYGHLQGGDFYVYFSRGPKGRYSEPRVAIRMENGEIAEVRGVNHRQELEPELLDIAAAKYKTLPGGEAYDKKTADMKRVTTLMEKKKNGEPFTHDDINFLLELDAPIEGFGYEKDPRLAELTPFVAEPALRKVLTLTNFSHYKDKKDIIESASEKGFNIVRWRKYEWGMPQKDSFSCVVLKRRESISLYSAQGTSVVLEELGLRPLTLSEMAIVGLQYKDLLKEAGYDYMTPQTFTDDSGEKLTPVIGTHGQYALGATLADPFETHEYRRILCTYK